MKVQIIQERGAPVTLKSNLTDKDAVSYCASLLRVFGAPVVYGEIVEEGMAIRIPGVPFSLLCCGLWLTDADAIGMTALVPALSE